MVIADVTATGDDNVLSAQANDVSYRKEQLRRLQEEVIELEDLKTGVSITDLGLNDFRMDLLNYVKEHGDLSHMPNGMHAVVPADPAMGLQPGVIFTLRNRNLNSDVNQHNPSTTACTPTTWSTSTAPARWCTTTPRSSACWTWHAPAAKARTSPSHTQPNSSTKKPLKADRCTSTPTCWARPFAP
jgi:hypothetical protein